MDIGTYARIINKQKDLIFYAGSWPLPVGELSGKCPAGRAAKGGIATEVLPP